MNNIKSTKRGENGIGKIGIILLLPFIILVIAYLAYQMFIIPAPVVKGVEAFALIPADKSVQLTGENIKSINVLVQSGDTSVELLKDMPATGNVTYNLQIVPDKLGLADGPAVVIITSKAGFFKEVKQEVKAVIDTVPPSVEVVKSPYMVFRGSGGFAILRAREADNVFVMFGSQKFRAFAAESDSESMGEEEVPGTEGRSKIKKQKKAKAKTYLAFFPAPYESEDGESFYAVAEDAAGNQSIKSMATILREKQYGSSTITIDDTFIKKVLVPLMNEVDLPDPAESFRQVNEEWRGDVLKRLVDISYTTEPRMLWEKRFLQLKNSKVMAEYGEKREYVLHGEPISESVHLGYDLASYARAKVNAANSGIVKFAGELSIYGNTVIIDHGMGLMSLYGHLSDITVEAGEPVGRGLVIGRTGSTGLAGGDHLHFGILLHGEEISPLYWWDSNWIEVNIFNVLSSHAAQSI